MGVLPNHPAIGVPPFTETASVIEISYATVIKHPRCTFAILKPFKTSGSNSSLMIRSGIKNKNQERGEYYNHLQSTNGKSCSLQTSIKGRRGL